MMTDKLGIYIIKNICKKIDFDGQYGAQCVDLIRDFLNNVYDLPQQPEGVVGAQDFFLKHDERAVQKKYLDRHEICVKGQDIPVGAIVVFRATATNKYGHIGVCIRTENNVIVLLEQDGFKQDGVKISRWNYDNVLGYLTKKEGV